MNLQEMLDEIPKRYPTARLFLAHGNWPMGMYAITLDNEWVISMSTGSSSASDRKMAKNHTTEETQLVELAIFTPTDDWYLAEGMEVSSDGISGVLGWQTSEQVFRIIDYISKKE